MVSVAFASLLLALVFVTHAATLQGPGVLEPELPLDVPRPATLPAKVPGSWDKLGDSSTTPGGKQRREAAESNPIPSQPNRPVIKPLASRPTTKPSTQPVVPNRQGLTKPAPPRPVRDSTSTTGLQKPQPLPGTANTHKPQTLPAQTGLNGNRQGLTKPAPSPSKPAQANTQRPQTLPSQTGLNGNRQGLAKPAPLPAHSRPERRAIDEEPEAPVRPGLSGTQKPQTLPAFIDRPLPAIAEKPNPLPPLAGTVRPQTIPAFLGTQRPVTIPAVINPHRPLTLVDPIPPQTGTPSPSDRPVRDTFQSATLDGQDKPQTLPALISPAKPQPLPPVGTQPVLEGNRDSFLRPAHFPTQ